MKFNSQICTNEQQSMKLLSLGLNPATADMKIDLYFPDEPSITPADVVIDWNKQTEFVPAWTLHRLMIMSGMKDFSRVGENIYDGLIYYIECLIKNNLFNTDYLI